MENRMSRRLKLPSTGSDQEKQSLAPSTNDKMTILNMASLINAKKTSPKHVSFYNTNACGTIKFPNSKKAKYIRIHNGVRASDLTQYLYSNEGFKLKRPKVIFSIVGGAKKLNMPPTWRKEFKSGVIKAAKTASAWIFTNGLNAGVTRLVGDGLCEEISTENIAVIGIAPWGAVENADVLVRDEAQMAKPNSVVRYYPKNCETIADKQDFSLNPFHTHFLLFDDGSKHELGREILFRANLEYESSKGKPVKDDTLRRKTEAAAIPIVLLVVRGGMTTLKLIHLYRKKIPIVLFAGTRGCADLIETCLRLPTEERTNERLGELIDVSGILEQVMNTPSHQKERDLAIRRLIDIIKSDCSFRIAICRIMRDVDVQTAILDALFRDNTNLAANFKLELLWNKGQISSNDSLQEKFEMLKQKDLEDLLEMSLLENNRSFVNSLLEKGINLEKFLTIERFDKLYNSRRGSKNKEPFSLYMQKLYSDFDDDSIITSETIKRFFKGLVFEQFNCYFLPENYSKENSKQYVKYAELNLFIWSVLFNQVEIAEIFWAIGENQICNALLGARIFKTFARHLIDNEAEYLENFSHFEKLAIGVMDVFDSNTLDSMNKVIMEAEVPFLKTDCLDFAVDCDCKRFVALPSIQDVITELWYRKLIHKSGSSFNLKFALCLLSFGILAPFLIIQQAETKKPISSLSAIDDDEDEEPEEEDNEFEDNVDHPETTAATPLLAIAAPLDHVDSKSTKSDFIDAIVPLQKKTEDDTKSDDTKSDDYRKVDIIVDLIGPNNSKNKTSVVKEKRIKGEKLKKAIKLPKLPNLPSLPKCNPIKSIKAYFKDYLEFFTTPMVLFVYYTIFYFLFLLTFSVTMLANFHFDYAEDDYYNDDGTYNESELFQLNDTSGFWFQDYTFSRKLQMISPLEYIICIWVFSLFFEEAKEIYTDEKTVSLKQNWAIYFEDEWNILDAAGCFIFLCGVFLRIISVITLNHDVFIWARIFLSIDLSVWYIRALYFCLAFRIAGPKLLMIRKMVDDFKFFLVIITIFMCSFAITVHSILYPTRHFTMKLVKRVLNLGYWTIFGEIFILDDLLADTNDSVEDNEEEEEEEESSNSCPSKEDEKTPLEPTGAFISSILLMIYMIISAVILINLVIAMFNSTYEAVEENSDIHWKFQRYQLLSESKGFCYLPPPLNLVYYIVILPFVCCYQCVKKNENKRKKDDDENDEDDDEHEMLDEQKCAQKYLREVERKNNSTIDARFDNVVEKLNNYDIRFMEMNNNRIELLQRIDESIEKGKENQKKLVEYEEKFIALRGLYEDLLNRLTDTNRMNGFTQDKMNIYQERVELLNRIQDSLLNNIQALKEQDDIIQKRLDSYEPKFEEAYAYRKEVMERIEVLSADHIARFDSYDVDLKSINENQNKLQGLIRHTLAQIQFQLSAQQRVTAAAAATATGTTTTAATGQRRDASRDKKNQDKERRKTE